MEDRIKTLWLGDWACFTMSEFPFNTPYEGVIKVSEYPILNPFKKNKNLPFMGNIPEDVLYLDLPELDPRGNATGKKIRVVFTDVFGNKSYDLAKNVPGLVSRERKLKSIEKINEELTIKYLELLDRFGYKMKDERTKELLEELDISKEAKKKLFSIMDMHKPGGNK